MQKLGFVPLLSMLKRFKYIINGKNSTWKWMEKLSHCNKFMCSSDKRIKLIIQLLNLLMNSSLSHTKRKDINLHLKGHVVIREPFLFTTM